MARSNNHVDREPAGPQQLEDDDARVEQFTAWEDDRFESRSDWPDEPAHSSSQDQNIGRLERLMSTAAGAGLLGVSLARRRWSSLLLGGLGAALIRRGYTGRCQCYAALGINTAERNPATAIPAKQGKKVQRTITIRRRPGDLFHFWRHLENIPRVMKNVELVKPLDSQRSHWVAKGPLGKRLEWDAEILNERENELIAWRSLPGGDIETAGSIRFKPSRRRGSTDVTVAIKYNPPAGKVGAEVAHWFGDGLEQKLDDDLNRLKKTLEAGKKA